VNTTLRTKVELEAFVQSECAMLTEDVSDCVYISRGLINTNTLFSCDGVFQLSSYLYV
jgi:hypothetical protein